MRDRVLPWDGCCNVRDLGGLETGDGARTSYRGLVRAENVERLTAGGWEALEAYGVRTVIDLRNDDELGADAAPRPGSVTTVRVPIDDAADTQMWEYFEAEGYGGLGPLYYPEFMRRKPERCAAAISAIARADGGGVLFYCAAGRDRTGLIAILALALADVHVGQIAADHAISDELVSTSCLPDGQARTPSAFDHLYAERGTTPAGIIAGLVDGESLGVDVRTYLRGGGATDAELDAVRGRLRPA
ncbi:tyrosine-protein phosphatase [Solicola gregarius]|uniref:Tyrosine-protein phosphatase n=1 Tax=Solicola gregarius TaxID=2908642 RepID=A0AA46YJK4_9ACTN|nr:tyrosine-protein phosphatase [Solicola gregarius]UYM04422.1 tyrosine-protein phosphatase [Solicola gregarius]